MENTIGYGIKYEIWYEEEEEEKKIAQTNASAYENEYWALFMNITHQIKFKQMHVHICVQSVEVHQYKYGYVREQERRRDTEREK